MKSKMKIMFAGCILTAYIMAGRTIQAKAQMQAKAYLEDGVWNCYVNGEIKHDYNGWIENAETGKMNWFDNGVMAVSKEVYDSQNDAWHWFDSDGTMAADKDVFIFSDKESEEGKWVRYDEKGKMIKGEDCRYGSWYHFDEVTGAMTKGFFYLSENDKWVYYDEMTGQMVYGESCINDSWYRFDEITGKMRHGETCENDNWYLYDEITGIMQKGEVYHNDNWYFYDEITGIMQKAEVYHNDNWYFYDEITGTMQKGVVTYNGNTYYYNTYLGVRQYGLVYYDGYWHLFDDETGIEKYYPNIVIVLDPGHDSTHAGAYGNGMAEQVLNFKIAQACKEELEQYKGVTVYMTHDTLACPFPGSSIKDDLINRTEYALSVGADLYLSLHNNSGYDYSGFEIYYPNDNYDSGQHEKGRAIAECIAEQLSELGINRLDVVSRNSDGYEDDDTNWYPDGSRADYYSVIRNSKYRGITGMIVEHAYLSNSYDAEEYLSSDEKLEALGIADASGVAAYYGLRKN